MCGEGGLNINLHTNIHCGITFPVAYMQGELSAVVFRCHSELHEHWLRVPCFISLVHVQTIHGHSGTGKMQRLLGGCNTNH